MNILAIFSKRKGLLTSIENKEVLVEGQTVFQSKFSTDTDLFEVIDGTCSDEVFNTLTPIVGTRETAVKIAGSTSTRIEGRVNAYATPTGILKIAD